MWTAEARGVLGRNNLVPLPFLAYARASAGLRRWLDCGDRIAGAFLSRALTSAEKSDLGVRIYNDSAAHLGLAMHPWEEAWLARRLPPAPARLLVGACGAGREVVWLASADYQIDAFDPAGKMTGLASRRLDDRAHIHTFLYEELSAAVLDGRDGPAAPLAGQRYDGVLLGWGSLTHVLDEAERLRLFRALHRLCPAGPILASFWCDHPTALAAGRADRLGGAAGRTVARWRKQSTEPSPREAFTVHAGFVHRFTPEEIGALGAAVGRTVIWDQDDTHYPHATFVA